MRGPARRGAIRRARAIGELRGGDIRHVDMREPCGSRIVQRAGLRRTLRETQHPRARHHHCVGAGELGDQPLDLRGIDARHRLTIGEIRYRAAMLHEREALAVQPCRQPARIGNRHHLRRQHNGVAPGIVGEIAHPPLPARHIIDRRPHRRVSQINCLFCLLLCGVKAQHASASAQAVSGYGGSSPTPCHPRNCMPNSQTKHATSRVFGGRAGRGAWVRPASGEELRCTISPTSV